MSNKRPNRSKLAGIDRRQFLIAGVLGMTGCGRILRRGQSPDELPITNVDIESTKDDVYVGDLTSVWGLNHFKIEGVGLVTRLDGTGSDPALSAQRTMLLGEMQSHQVPEPNGLLAGKDTSMVIVQGFIPPAIRKGERFDVNVTTMPRSETTSLEGGFLMQTRLRRMEVLGGRLKKGHVNALAKGSVIVDSIFDGEDEVSNRRGRIYGGAVAMNDRPVGLVVQSDSKSVQVTTRIARRINERFHTTENGGKAGVATPKNDQVIELVVPQLYKDNISRYMGIISNVMYRGTSDVIARIERLESELLEPSLASRAALRLEGIGKDGIAALNRGARSQDIEVQFYASEALAYLGESSAAKSLGRLAMEEPAFRWRAMTALSTMDDLDAGIALSNLLHTNSAETRYGAFRSLYTRSPSDPAIHQEQLPKADFAYHLIPTTENPMIHFSRSRRPEIVLFGHDQRVSDDFLYVNSGLTVKADGGALKITRFARSGDDERIECASTIDDLVRNLSSMGYGYGELLQLLRRAKESDSLESRLVIDALPGANRRFDRDARSDDRDAIDAGSEIEVPERFVHGPVPELFQDVNGESKVRQASHEEDYDPAIDEFTSDEDEKKRPLRDGMKRIFKR